MIHAHKFLLTTESVFGLKNVHAVGKCIGTVDGEPCKASFIGVVPVADLEKHGIKRPTYFYRPPADLVRSQNP